MTQTSSNPFTITVSPAPPAGGARWLYFKGNGHDAGRNGDWDRIAVQRYFYLAKDSAMAPWSSGMTLTWQIIPIRHAAYFSTFFFAASSGTDFYDLPGYVGCHPYPHSAFGQSDGENFTRHKWEIALDGNDYTSELVQYGRVHNQAMIYTQSGEVTFYTDINAGNPGPSFSAQAQHNTGYHANSALVFGNCPWWNAHQHERLSGFIRRIKVFASALSAADTLSEAMSDSLATGNAAALWWSKIDFATADDLQSDFGIAKTAAWIDGHRAEVVAGTDLAQHPAMAAPGTIQRVHQERG